MRVRNAKNNLIVYGLPEKTDAIGDEGITSDCVDMNEIFRTKVLGKSKIFKQDFNVFICPDGTPRQRDYCNKIKSELEQKKSSREGVQLKFIRGVPVVKAFFSGHTLVYSLTYRVYLFDWTVGVLSGMETKKLDRRLYLISLEYLRKMSHVIFVYKVINNIIDCISVGRIGLVVTPHNLRHTRTFFWNGLVPTFSQFSST